MDFLSLKDTPLEENEVIDITDEIDRFILDMQHIVNIFKNNKDNIPQYLDKFKLIHDVIGLYNSSEIKDILTNIRDISEIDICNDEFNRNIMNNNTSSDISNNEDSDRESSSDQDDDFQDIYLAMIDREYENIQTNSVLKKYINIIRKDSVSFNN